MRIFLFKLWDTLRSSYWFIPTLMSLGSIVLAFGMVAVDTNVGTAWADGLGWINVNRPEGARAVLSTIAGSMITVAGVVFSVTIAAVSYASGQYGPRLLTQFLRDTGNQVTLGAFIATFLYCLLVLRNVQGADGSEAGEGFVPHLAILVGLVLTLGNIGVLIYFLHHIPRSIHISVAIATIGQELLEHIEERFPQSLGQGPEEQDGNGVVAEAAVRQGPAADVTSVRSGYVQAVDEQALFQAARRHDLVLRLHYRPGDFVRHGRTLLEAWPAERVDDTVRKHLREAYAQGRLRTPSQDLLFLIEELVEIAARALSPGVNDPFTATRCLDWLGNALGRLAQRDLPSPLRYDDDGHLRVIARPMRFTDYLEASFGRLRPYVAADRNAALHTFKTLGEVAVDVQRTADRAALRPHADRLLRACEQNLDDEATLADVRERHRQVLRLLRSPANAEAVQREQDWRDGRT